MADDDNKQVEIEVALRDTASQTLRGISREIDNITRKLVETGRRGSEAFEGMRRKGTEAGQGSEKAARGVDEFSKSISGLTKGLAGPVGLAAAFYAVGKSLANFAQHRVELSLLTTDLGLTLTKINDVKQILMRKGLSEDAAKGFITGIAGQLQDLRVRDVYSDFYRKLAIYGDDKLGDDLLRSVKSGNIDKAFETIIAHVQKLMGQGEAGRLRARYFTNEVLGQALSSFTDWDAASKGLIKVYEANEEEARKAQRENADLATRAGNVMRHFVDIVIEQINLLDNEYARSKAKMPNAPDTGGAPKTSGTGPGTSPTPGTPPATGPGGASGAGGAGAPSTQPLIEVRPGKQSSLEDRGTSDATDFSSVNRRRGGGVAGAIREIAPVEKDTNRTLIEIRDVLNAVYGNNPIKVASLGDSPTSPGGQTDATQPGGGKAGPGGTKPGLTDQSGKGVDPVTVGRIQEFAARGDTVGMRNMMRTNGYRVDSNWCGDVTRVIVGGSGFQVPKGYPIASNWRSPVVGEVIPGAGINEPGRTLGGITASKTNVPIGSLGGHVMAIVPGTYNPKDNSAVVIDTRGRRRRSLNGFEIRWAGKEAEERAARARAGQPNASVVPPGGPPGMPQGTPVPSNAINGVPQSPRPAVGGRTVRASTFDDKVTASGQPRTVPGIALPSRATLGQWFYVRDENTGKEILVQQTDVGPAKWTKRGIDINAPLARKFGYPNAKSFPTDSNFSYRPALDRANRGAGPQASRSRSGNVKATVDFGAMARVKEAGEIFHPIRTASFGQGTTVTRNSVLPGSSDYSRWTA